MPKGKRSCKGNTKRRDRRIQMILLAGILLLLSICGAGAYFIQRMEKRIEVRAAQLSLETRAFGKETSLDREISRDTVLYISGEVVNTGQVAVYLSEETILERNGATADSSIVLEVVSGPDGNTPLQPGEVRQYKYKLSFPGADSLPEGSFNVLAELLVTACTSQSGAYGFKSGPYALVLGDFSGDKALNIPPRQRAIRLTALYEKGTDALEEICWFRSTAGAAHSAPKGDEISDWTAVASIAGRTEELVLKSGESVLLYYELRTGETTVRSNLYRFSFVGGSLTRQDYDYFTGKELAS